MKIALTFLSFIALTLAAYAASELTESACLPPAIVQAIA